MKKVSDDSQVEVRAAVAWIELGVLNTRLFERGERPSIDGVGRPERRAGVCNMVDVEAWFLQDQCVVYKVANIR